MSYFSTLLLSFFLTIGLIPVLRTVAVRINAVDFPNERKVHTRPTPKIGGIGMAFGALVPILLWAPGGLLVRAILVGAGIVAVGGFLDDIKNLDYKLKFAAQFAAAIVVIFYGGVQIKSLGLLLPENVLLPEWISRPLTLVVMVGVTNAINLADGLDGLAGGITMISFFCLGYLAYLVDNTIVVFFSAACCGAIFGFLRFNTYPAIVFMGDAGSQTLGFLAITLSLSLTQGNTPLNPLLPLLILGFPVLDTLTVMAGRIAGGRSPFVADKKHFHHKLMSLGLYHTEAVLTIYSLHTVMVLTAIFFRYHFSFILLLFYLAFSIVIIGGFLSAKKYQWRFSRSDVIDIGIKGKLKILKDRQILIRTSFASMRYMLPALLIFTCILPSKIPSHFSLISLGILIIMNLARLVKAEISTEVLRFALYLSIPYVVYLSQLERVEWAGRQVIICYHVFLGLLVFLSVMTLKFTRRRKGFKTTPMDFLILFIVFTIPNLPGLMLYKMHMGILAVKIIIFLFGFEILIGELRGNLKRLWQITMVVLLIIFIRGLI